LSNLGYHMRFLFTGRLCVTDSAFPFGKVIG
jgi:hypothetical protein